MKLGIVGLPTGKALQRCVGTRRLRLPTLWNMTGETVWLA